MVQFLLLPFGASLVAQLIKKPYAMQDIRAGSLGWEDSLEKGLGLSTPV